MHYTMVYSRGCVNFTENFEKIQVLITDGMKETSKDSLINFVLCPSFGISKLSILHYSMYTFFVKL